MIAGAKLSTPAPIALQWKLFLVVPFCFSFLASVITDTRRPQLLDAMTTSPAAIADLSEDPPIAEPQDQTSTPVSIAPATLVPTADSMSMEHIFFSLKHLESRITHLEQNNAQTERTGTTSYHLEALGLMTRAEHEQEIRRLENTIHTMQLAHQALNIQFEKVTATLAAFNRQIQESQEIYGTMRTMLTSLRGLVDQSQSDSVPSNWRRM